MVPVPDLPLSHTSNRQERPARRRDTLRAGVREREAATRTVVAATKLAIPRSRRQFLTRPDLGARLDGDFRVALVSAPAGYGKTATLAAWAADRGPDLAWLSCDSSDAEPTRFMSCLLSAISTRWPGVADDAFVLLERDGANTYDSAVAVANELATVDAPGVIVVDDLHLAAPDPVTLAAFIGALPDTFRFVAGTRSDPPLPLGRLRLRGELLEIRGDELRFSGSEMAEFFQLHGVQLPVDQRARLHELTEGWPAGAQLAAIALQRGIRRDDFLEAFASTDRAVGDFLVSEVLASLPPELVEFLIETSVLDAFDAELCRAVAGVEQSTEIIEHLLAANLFLVPLDERTGWYRYHHLFGAFLRARLASLGKSRVLAARDRACRALAERGDVAGALQHAMAMGDVGRAGDLLSAAISRSMTLLEGADVAIRAVRLWLHELGAQFIESDPTRVVEFVIGLITLTGPDDAPRWLERVRQAHPRADGELLAIIEGAWGEHHQHRGQAREAIRHLDAAFEAFGGTPPNSGLLPLAYAASARAHIQAGDFDRAGALLESALARPTGNAVADEVRHPGIAAFVAATAGELSRAERLVAKCVQSADELGLDRHEPGTIFAGLALVEVHLERHEHDAARRTLDEVTPASQASHRLTLQSLVTLQHAKLARALGDAAGADALLAQARLFYVDPDDAVRQVFGEEAVAQAVRFDPDKAPSLIADLDDQRVETRVLSARLALVQNDGRAAELLLGDLPAATTRRGRVQRSVLCALSVLHRDVEQANRHLAEALLAGQPERLIRSIVDQGPDAHKLLLSGLPDASQEPYLEELIAAASNIVAAARPAAIQVLVEPLSPREVTVLRYLCSRLTYQEIAAALYVSPNTLKSHVKSVYRKLDAPSRADAVSTGRRLGVI